jgi:hypothetical protein
MLCLLGVPYALTSFVFDGVITRNNIRVDHMNLNVGVDGGLLTLSMGVYHRVAMVVFSGVCVSFRDFRNIFDFFTRVGDVNQNFRGGVIPNPSIFSAVSL